MIDDGYIEQFLLSQDVFLKIMLTQYGGFGYAYILRQGPHWAPQAFIDWPGYARLWQQALAWLA